MNRTISPPFVFSHCNLEENIKVPSDFCPFLAHLNWVLGSYYFRLFGLIAETLFFSTRPFCNCTKSKRISRKILKFSLALDGFLFHALILTIAFEGVFVKNVIWIYIGTAKRYWLILLVEYFIETINTNWREKREKSWYWHRIYIPFV